MKSETQIRKDIEEIDCIINTLQGITDERVFIRNFLQLKKEILEDVLK